MLFQWSRWRRQMLSEYKVLKDIETICVEQTYTVNSLPPISEGVSLKGITTPPISFCEGSVSTDTFTPICF